MLRYKLPELSEAALAKNNEEDSSIMVLRCNFSFFGKRFLEKISPISVLVQVLLHVASSLHFMNVGSSSSYKVPVSFWEGWRISIAQLP